jgi:hypothetical protein
MGKAQDFLQFPNWNTHLNMNYILEFYITEGFVLTFTGLNIISGHILTRCITQREAFQNTTCSERLIQWVSDYDAQQNMFIANGRGTKNTTRAKC